MGKRAARRADRSAGKGGWKKRKPPCNETDRRCAMRQDHSTRKRADFHRVFPDEKTEIPTPETKQMAAVETQAGAVPNGQIDWTTINWRTVNQNVRRLQSRIDRAEQLGDVPRPDLIR